MKIIRTLVLMILLLLCCGAFDEITEMPAEEIFDTEVLPVEEVPAAEELTEEIPEEEIPVEEAPLAEELPFVEDLPVEPLAEELPQAEWQGINSDQAEALRALYDQMTSTGQFLSGWFAEGSGSPCDWQGVTCEEGQVTALEFRDALYFTLFPSGLDSFQSLKELHFVDTLIQGTLPETLWEDLPSLEVLELSGNLLTGEIPPLPEQFEAYPVLRKIILRDNKLDERKQNLSAFAEASSVYLDPLDYPEIDLTPGLDGLLPEDWSRLPLLSEIDLSGNVLGGVVPDSWMQLPLTAWDLSDNAMPLSLSQAFYDWITASGNAEIKLDGLEIPAPESVTPEEEPTATAIPEEIPMEVPFVPPVLPEAPQPTEAPTVVATAVPLIQPTSVPVQPIYIVVTATSQPQWYTATPVPYQPQNPQQPQPNPQQPYPNGNQPQQPTLMVYPISSIPTQVPTAAPTDDPAVRRRQIAASLGFTYVLDSMTQDSLPMTWRNNGLSSYSISYLDANGNLYPAYAMTWTPAEDLCHSDTCTFTVTGVPEELLYSGTFSLRLEAKDANGQLYQTDPVTLAVSVPEPEPAPQPQLNVLSTLLRWLFSPILNLFR